MDSNRSDDTRPADAVALFWLRTVVLITLFISALGALIAFRSLLIYGGAVTGRFELVDGTAEHELFQMIRRNPLPHLVLEGFNLALWLGVLIGATHLLRLREWARIFIKTLITIDLFVTLGVACWPAVGEWIYQEPVRSDVQVDLLVTTIEVLIVLGLSHPRVISVTVMRESQKEMRRISGARDHRRNGTD